MNVFVNLLKILIVLLSIAVVAIVIMLGLMVLVPSVSLFGIHFVNGDNKVVFNYYDIKSAEHMAEWANIDTVSITTDSWDIYVYPVDKTEHAHTKNGIDARLYRNYSGFSNNAVSEATISDYIVEDKADGKHLSISTIEPTGWFSRFNCALYIYVGEDALANKQLLLTSKSGKIEVGDTIQNKSQTLEIKTLKMVTDSGNSYLNDVNVTSGVDIVKKSGNIYLNTDMNCDVELSITSGLGNIYTKAIGSVEKSRSIIIHELYNCGVELGNVYGSLMVNANWGSVKAGEVTGMVVFEGKSCNLNLDKVGGKMFFNSVDGSVSVNEAQILVADISGNGSVSVNKLQGASAINSTTGAIEIQNVFKDIVATTTSGDITLNNATDATVNYVIESTNGNVTVTNVIGSVNFNVNNDGRSSFVGSYQKMIGENVIKTNSGEINISMLNAQYGFLFKEWATTTSVYFKLSGFEQFNVCKSADDDVYKNGVKIGGYTKNDDTLSIISNMGKLCVVHPNLS